MSQQRVTLTLRVSQRTSGKEDLLISIPLPMEVTEESSSRDILTIHDSFKSRLKPSLPSGMSSQKIQERTNEALILIDEISAEFMLDVAAHVMDQPGFIGGYAEAIVQVMKKAASDIVLREFGEEPRELE